MRRKSPAATPSYGFVSRNTEVACSSFHKDRPTNKLTNCFVKTRLNSIEHNLDVLG